MFLHTLIVTLLLLTAVHSLTELSSDSTILTENEKSTLVFFYAPWCGHCKRFLPDFERFVEAWESEYKNDEEVEFIKVNCDEHRTVCGDMSIRGYPTLMFYTPKQGESHKFGSARTFDGLLSFMNNHLSKKRDLKDPKAAKEVPQDKEESIPLLVTGDTFDAQLKKKSKTLVFFYAEWCGHCKKAKPAIETLAKEFANDAVVQVVTVNAAEDRKLAERFNIKGFPTIKLFTKDSDEMGEDYRGDRSVEDLKKFIISSGKKPTAKEQPTPKEQPPKGLERLLQEQNQLLKKQNQILNDVLQQVKKILPGKAGHDEL